MRYMANLCYILKRVYKAVVDENRDIPVEDHRLEEVHDILEKIKALLDIVTDYAEKWEGDNGTDISKSES